MAEEIAARYNALLPLSNGPRLRISISDPVTDEHMATAFVAYDVPDTDRPERPSGASKPSPAARRGGLRLVTASTP
ncbi:hypothetical protein C1N81_39555 [Streptomyces sp. SGAir0957]